jgi:hypothetical protein
MLILSAFSFLFRLRGNYAEFNLVFQVLGYTISRAFSFKLRLWGPTLSLISFSSSRLLNFKGLFVQISFRWSYAEFNLVFSTSSFVVSDFSFRCFLMWPATIRI